MSILFCVRICPNYSSLILILIQYIERHLNCKKYISKKVKLILISKFKGSIKLNIFIIKTKASSTIDPIGPKPRIVSRHLAICLKPIHTNNYPRQQCTHTLHISVVGCANASQILRGTIVGG